MLPEDFFHLATAGLIRAQSNAVTGASKFGPARPKCVRFTSFEREKPFPIANIDL